MLLDIDIDENEFHGADENMLKRRLNMYYCN